MAPDALSTIQFHYLVAPFHFPERKRLKEFLFDNLTRGGREVEAVNYVFCSDEYLLRMNEEYLQHDTLTDIITFELSPKGQALVADVFISIDRVRENARDLRVRVGAELLRVVFHGALHLLGFNDKKAADAKEMRVMEDSWLEMYNVPRGIQGGQG